MFPENREIQDYSSGLVIYREIGNQTANRDHRGRVGVKCPSLGDSPKDYLKTSC